MYSSLAAEKFRREIQFDPALKEILLQETGHHLGKRAGTDAAKMVPVVAKLREGSTRIPDLNIVSRMGNIVTGRVGIHRIVALRQHPAVASLKASSGFISDLANSVTEIGASRESMRLAGIPEISGKNVVIGIIDWGADFAHRAFRNGQGKTRLWSIWDQRDGKTAQSPQPYGYGTVHSRDDINRALRHSDPYRALGYDPADIDARGEGTHGTHVMSIAAGRGRVPGVAPGAELIFVHLKGSDTRPEDTLGDSVRLLEAVDYILRQSGDWPVVINLSLGRTGDAKDGTSPVEQALDAIVREKPGRVLCMSTGNYYNAKLHAQGHLSAGETRLLR